MPVDGELGPEQVVVNYAPTRLRLFLPDAAPATAPSSYMILGSERPELPAAFRPLGGTAVKPVPQFAPRPDRWVFVAGHVVEAAEPPAGAMGPRFSVYDADGKAATTVDVKLPMACAARGPALLSTDGVRLYAALRCESGAVLLYLDDKANLLTARSLTGASRVELFLHQPDADYVLSGRQVLRFAVGSDALPAIGAVPTPDDGPAPARELLRADDLILVVDGQAGRVTALAKSDMAWRFEKRFAVGRGVRAVRAAIGAPGRLSIVTWEDAAPGRALFATVLDLASRAGEPPRIFLGAGLAQPPPELVPIAESDRGGALLVFVHAGNSGPLVALRRLTL